MSTEAQLNWLIGVEDATTVGIASVYESFVGLTDRSMSQLSRTGDAFSGLVSVAKDTAFQLGSVMSSALSNLFGGFFDPVQDALSSATEFWRSSAEEQSRFLDARKASLDAVSMQVAALTTNIEALRRAESPNEEMLNALKRQRAALDGQRLSIMLTTGAFHGLKAAQSGLNKANELFGGMMSRLGRLFAPIIDIITSIFGPALEYLSSIIRIELEPVTVAFFQLAQRLAPAIVQIMTPLAEGLIQIVQVLSDKLLAGPDAPILVLFEAFGEVLLAMQEPLTLLLLAFADLMVYVADLAVGGLLWITENILPLLADNMDIVTTALKYGLIALVAFKAITIGASIAVGAYNIAMGLFSAITIAAQVATWLFNAALYANPIGLVVLAIIGAVAALAALIYYWEDVVDAMSAAWEWMADFIEPAIDAVVLGFNAMIDALSSAVTWLWDMREYLLYVVSPAYLLYTALAALAGILIDGVGAALSWVGRQFEALWNSAVWVAEQIGSAFMGVVHFFSETLPNAIGSAFSWVADMVDGMIQGVRSAFTGVVEALGAALEWVGDVFGYLGDLIDDFFDLIGDLGDSIADAFTAIPKLAGDAVDYVVDAFDGLWDSITGVFSDLETWFSRTFTDLWQSVTSFFSRAASSLLSFLGLDSAAEEISGIFSTISEMLYAPIEAMKNLINDNVVDVINSILTFEVAGVSLSSDLGLGKVPYLAEGGIVGANGRAGTQAVVGEAGPEAVLPLQPSVLERIIPVFNAQNSAEAIPSSAVAALEHGSEADKEQLQVLRQIGGLLTQVLDRLDQREPPAMIPLNHA